MLPKQTSSNLRSSQSVSDTSVEVVILGRILDDRISRPPTQKQLAKPPSSLTNHASQVPMELPVISLDPDGDLRLRVGSETDGRVQDFVVCSRTMGRSSPVWKAMLFGGYKEAKPVEGEWVVPLPEEHPKALLTVLNIIHGRFANVPKKPTLEQLYLIMALTDKYDMVQKVQPWAASWGTLISSLAEARKGGVALLTFVAWELGHREIFCSLVNDVVYTGTVDSEGRLTTSEGHCLDEYDHFGPDDLIARICDIRRTAIQCLLNLINEFIKCMSNGLRCAWHKPFPRNDEDRLACDSMILGSFWKSTIKVRAALFPSSANSISSSVKTLALEILKSLDGIICDQRHKECNPAERLQKLVVDTVQSRQSPVTSNHLKFLKTRRAELGLAEDKSTRAT